MLGKRKKQVAQMVTYEINQDLKQRSHSGGGGLALHLSPVAGKVFVKDRLG